MICYLVIHWLLALPPSLTTTCNNNFGWSFFFFLMVLIVSFAFYQPQVLPLMLQVHLQWKWTYYVLYHILQVVLSEHTCLMTILVTSCSLLIFVWFLMNKWEFDFSLVSMCFSFLVSWVDLKLGYIGNWTCLLKFG
jgi:hypothetical protein